MSLKTPVYKTVLENGLTILSFEMQNIPKVSTQLWYNVGSKHEQPGQYGIAHVLEHMCFKGTKKLSELDINTILADCMHNCKFKPELLNSELHAIMQELKMYQDNYQEHMIDELLQVIFIDHAYQHPIIGKKTDICAVTSATLHDFYHTYYAPNNATLVVVGPLKHSEIVRQANTHFGKFVSQKIPVHNPRELEPNFIAKNIVLERDVQQPLLSCAFITPGIAHKVDYTLDLISWLMGSGRGSRLYKELVEEKKLATYIDTVNYDLFENTCTLINIQPQKNVDLHDIINKTKAIFAHTLTGSYTAQEYARAQAKVKADFISFFEHTQKIAYAIGKSYLATGDHHCFTRYLEHKPQEIKKQIAQIHEHYLRPEFMHTAATIPMNNKQKKLWCSVQEKIDQQDQCILQTKKRSTHLETIQHAKQITPKKPEKFDIPRPQIFTLKNGLQVMYVHDEQLPKIELILELKADNLYEPKNKEGLHNFVSQAITQGTKKYPGQRFADFIESRGMNLSCSPGFVSLSMLNDVCADGLHVLTDMLTHASFLPKEIKKVRAHINANIAEYWDDPYQFCNALVRTHIYGQHAYGKIALGTKKTIKNITGRDIKECYHHYFSPDGARLALVGNLSHINIRNLLEETIGTWQGPKIDDLTYPKIKPVKPHTINHPLHRDQIVLAYAGLSIERKHPDYDALLLFDQIFGGGVLGSMSSRLFQIREQTGLFYTIAGSVLVHASKQPGLSLVKTLVSKDRLKEAEKALVECIITAPKNISEEELKQAKNAIINALPDNFETYKKTAATFLYAKRFNLPENYFDQRAQQLEKITPAHVQQAAARVLDINKMICVRIGRVV